MVGTLLGRTGAGGWVSCCATLEGTAKAAWHRGWRSGGGAGGGAH